MLRALWEAIYPKGGWTRAYTYVKHRLRRLPGTPEQIARGIAVGVFTSFTPFYGLHFVVAALLAVATRSSILAALSGTFFGNPLTYIPIGASALGTGYAILGTRPRMDVQGGVGTKFVNASADMWNNFLAMFTDAKADWSYLAEFWDNVFFPWLIGGIPPGLICAVIIYYLSVPTIRVYKNRRKGRLTAKLAELRKKAQLVRDDDTAS